MDKLPHVLKHAVLLEELAWCVVSGDYGECRILFNKRVFRVVSPC